MLSASDVSHAPHTQLNSVGRRGTYHEVLVDLVRAGSRLGAVVGEVWDLGGAALERRFEAGIGGKLGLRAQGADGSRQWGGASGIASQHASAVHGD